MVQSRLTYVSASVPTALDWHRANLGMISSMKLLLGMELRLALCDRLPTGSALEAVLEDATEFFVYTLLNA